MISTQELQSIILYQKVAQKRFSLLAGLVVFACLCIYVGVSMYLHRITVFIRIAAIDRRSLIINRSLAVMRLYLPIRALATA